MLELLNETKDYIQKKITKTPQLAIVLGSGLGVFAEKIEDKITIPYEEIPHFPKTTVKGHAGALIVGTLEGVDIIAFAGRFHAYEGVNVDTVVRTSRVASLLGCKYFFLTNASGGINSSYGPGDLISISDHINMTGKNPLVGPNLKDLGERFPDMSEVYNKKLRKILSESALSIGLTIREGIYAGVLGPSYETPAEINMLKVLGADLVGMSTVLEAIAAHHAGLEVVAVACVTNMASGIADEKLKHSDVEQVAKTSIENFSKLIKQFIKNLGAQ